MPKIIFQPLMISNPAGRLAEICIAFSDASSFEYALLSAMPLPTLRAFSLDDEGDGVVIETLRQFEARNMNILHTE